jgi:hypothetical protein
MMQQYCIICIDKAIYVRLVTEALYLVTLVLKMVIKIFGFFVRIIFGHVAFGLKSQRPYHIQFDFLCTLI